MKRTVGILEDKADVRPITLPVRLHVPVILSSKRSVKTWFGPSKSWLIAEMGKRTNANTRRAENHRGKTMSGLLCQGAEAVIVHLDGHDRGTTRRKKELWSTERLDLFDGGIGSDFAKQQALGSDVDEGEFGDDMIDNFDAG